MLEEVSASKRYNMEIVGSLGQSYQQSCFHVRLPFYRLEVSFHILSCMIQMVHCCGVHLRNLSCVNSKGSVVFVVYTYHLGDFSKNCVSKTQFYQILFQFFKQHESRMIHLFRMFT